MNACSLDAYERVVDAIFSMPSDLMVQDEVPGTPNSLQVLFAHTSDWRCNCDIILVLHLCSSITSLHRSLNMRIPAQVSARNAVVDAIERVFEVHGAVPMDSSDVGFCPIDAPADIAAMLSTSGAQLAMRHACLHLCFMLLAFLSKTT